MFIKRILHFSIVLYITLIYVLGIQLCSYPPTNNKVTYATIKNLSKKHKEKGDTIIILHATIHTTSTSICTSLKTRASIITPTTLRILAFGNFLTQEIMDTPIEAWSLKKDKRGTYNVASTLVTAPDSFGQISPNHSFFKGIYL